MVMTVSAASAPSRSRRRRAEEQHGQRHLGGVEEQVAQLACASSSLISCSVRTTSSKVDVSSAGTWRTAWRSIVAVDASRATCGGTSIMQMSWTSMRRSARALETAISNSRSPAGPDGVVRPLRRRDQRVRGERALLGAGQVEHPRVRRELRHRAQPGQRAGRVEQRDLDAAARGQVAQRAEQGRLAAAGLGDEDREAGALADLHREVQVEEDRPAGGAGGAPDQVAAPVADGGGGLRQRRRRTA